MLSPRPCCCQSYITHKQLRPTSGLETMRENYLAKRLMSLVFAGELFVDISERRSSNSSLWSTNHKVRTICKNI